MKTSTLYRAFRETYRRALLSNSDFRIRQWRTFERELLRRMDQYDDWREIDNRLPKLSDMRGIFKGHLKPEYEGMASEDIIADVRRKMWGDE